MRFDSTLRAAWLGGAAVHAMWDSWLWVPHRIGFVLGSRLDAELPRGLVCAGELGVGVLVPIGDDDGAETDVVVQAAAEGGYRAGPVTSGLRLTLYAITTADADDAQFAVEPFVRLFLDPAFLWLSLVMNIDEPFGFSFDDAKVWGLHLGGGARY